LDLHEILAVNGFFTQQGRKFAANQRAHFGMTAEPETESIPGTTLATEEAGDVEPVRVDYWLLRFSDPEVEARYRRDHIRRVLPFIRIALLCGSILYGFFGVLDAYLIEHALAEVLAIRFIGGCGTLLLALALSYTRLFDRHNQLILSIAMLNCGLGIVAMTAVADAPANETYYAGMIMVIIYAAILIHCRVIYTIAVTVTMVAAYFLVVTVIAPLPTKVIVGNSFFLIMSLGVSIFACYALDLGWRQRFSRFLALQRASDVAIALKNDAVSANHAKTEFLATMSHELRTPLNAILGFSDIMKAGMYGPLGSSKYEDYAEDIHDSARHLLSIITDILDYSKTESGTIELDEVDVNTAELIERSVRVCNQIASSKGVRLNVEMPEWTPLIRADRRLLQQALMNLLSNAIKFTPSAGEVKVVASHSEDGGCSLVVSDTGIGIATEDQARVFEPFAQVQSAFAREQGGTGLGLPLVRRVAEMHGGSVTLNSRLGEGTAITIALPASRSLGFAEFDENSGPGFQQAS
jgi:two-component system cell cycle sensor histidine kinase PleC